MAAQKVYGEAVQKEAADVLGRLRDAHMLVVGVIGSVMLRTQGKLAPFDKDREARNALFATLIVGMGLCEQSIEEGRYLQGQALLRQELELLAELVAVRTKTRRRGKKPSVADLEQSLKRLYGSLSDAAHLSEPELVRDLTRYEFHTPDDPGSVSGTRYFPVLEEVAARRSFALHIYILIHAIAEVRGDIAAAHPDEAITEQEIEAINLAIRIMISEGVLESVDAT